MTSTSRLPLSCGRVTGRSSSRDAARCGPSVQATPNTVAQMHAVMTTSAT